MNLTKTANKFPSTTTIFIKGNSIKFPIRNPKENSLKYIIKIGNVKTCDDKQIDIPSLKNFGNLYNFLFIDLLNSIIPRVAKKLSWNPTSKTLYGLYKINTTPAIDNDARGL